MSMRTASLLAVFIAALMLLVGALTSCAGSSAPSSEGLDIPVFYLYPGEPAPVEGPQLRTRDFEILLNELARWQKVSTQN